MDSMSTGFPGRRAARAVLAAERAHLLQPWDGLAPFVPARNLGRIERSGILREIVARHTDGRGRPDAIRRIAARLGCAKGTVYAWLKSSEAHPVPPVEIDLLRMDDAALHGVLRTEASTAALIRQLYEVPAVTGPHHTLESRHAAV